MNAVEVERQRGPRNCAFCYAAGPRSPQHPRSEGMIPAHITRLMTFAQHGQPAGYAASDMMRNDLETLIMSATKPSASSSGVTDMEVEAALCCTSMASAVPEADMRDALEKFVKSRAASAQNASPIDMVLYCPKCGQQHVDAPEYGEPPAGSVFDGSGIPDWSNPPHRSHLCHGCGHIWRPADVPTNGVAAVKSTGKADSPIAQNAAPVALQATAREQDLAMFIRRIVSSARRNCEDGSNVLKMANDAWDYLVRVGLEGSPLRDAGIESDPTPAQGDAKDAAWYRWLCSVGPEQQKVIAHYGLEEMDNRVDAALAAKGQA